MTVRRIFRPIDRRTMLRSVGAAAIGLPLLEEMSATAATGATAVDPPVRAFNVFFGLGIPAPLQKEGWGGVLEPLAPLRDKLLLLQNVDQVRCDEAGSNAHYDGAIGAFTAQPPNGEARAGGPSIDQMVRQACYPEGLPTGMAGALVAGTFFRRSRVGRYVHSFQADGTVAAAMQEKPRDLFQRIFGRPPGQTTVGNGRRRQSVLDTVIEDYRFYTGDNSPLGTASRRRLTDHLERIREYEHRVFALPDRKNDAPVPPPSKVPHGGTADPGGQGIDITLAELTTEWRLLAELYALAIQTDHVRFGSITFLAAGERIRLKGDYEYDGEKRWHFDDAAQQNATGDLGCSHEWWHRFDPKKKNEALRAHAHMKMREVAYFLSLLDGESSREANGKTILENSLLTISTESGDGRHNDSKRELSGVFHAVTGAGGRFKTDQSLDVGAEGLDVYNTMLEAMGVSEKMGPADRPYQAVDAIRA